MSFLIFSYLFFIKGQEFLFTPVPNIILLILMKSVRGDTVTSRNPSFGSEDNCNQLELKELLN